MSRADRAAGAPRRTRAERRNRLVKTGALTLALAAVVGGLAGRSALVEHRSTEVVVELSSAVGLYEGSDVQVLGVSVGRVVELDPEPDRVRVTLRLDPGRKVAAGTAAVLVAPTVVADRYVQLTEPWTEGPALSDGAVISLADTAVPVEIDELYTSLEDVSTQLGPDGANRSGALADLLDVAAENLGGNGEDINTALRDFSALTTTVSGVDQDLFATVANLASFSDMLVENDVQIGELNTQFAAVSDYLAADRDDLAAAVAHLGSALAVLDDFVAENRGDLQASVEALVGPTQTLVDQRASLDELVRTAPLALQNFLQAYDPTTGTLQGRANLNEANLWTTDGTSARTSPSAPPVLLPGVGEQP